MRHRRRYLWFRGLSATVEWWAVRVGIAAETVHARLARGWDVRSALTTPVRGRPRRCPGLVPHGGTDPAAGRYKIDGKRLWVYLGIWGTDQAEAAYERFVRRWLAILKAAEKSLKRNQRKCGASSAGFQPGAGS